MGKISLFIDGTEIQAEEGMSVLEASLAAGIYIPHLCSHPDLPATGGCKMCVVEIDGQEAPVSSCVTEVQEGMKVHTKTEQLSQLPEDRAGAHHGRPSPRLHRLPCLRQL